MPREPRVRITSEGGVGSRAKVYVGDQLLTNCQRVELVLDAKEVVRAVLHLIDIDVDVEAFAPDTVVMVQPVAERVVHEVRVKSSELDGHQIVRELRRLKQDGIQP